MTCDEYARLTKEAKKLADEGKDPLKVFPNSQIMAMGWHASRCKTCMKLARKMDREASKTLTKEENKQLDKDTKAELIRRMIQAGQDPECPIS